MKLEKNIYVIMKVGTPTDAALEEIGTGFLKVDNFDEPVFTDDIENATTVGNYKIALHVKHEYEDRHKFSTELDWKIVPLKITYVW